MAVHYQKEKPVLKARPYRAGRSPRVKMKNRNIGAKMEEALRDRRKITFGEMGGWDYNCGWIAISGDQWPDHVRLSDFEVHSFVRLAGSKVPNLADFNWPTKRTAVLSTRADSVRS
jgi:hypothetical protein